MTKFMKALPALLLGVMVLVAGCSTTPADKLSQIRDRGVLLVGSTGDYKPMNYYNEQTGAYEGFDVELSQKLADSLGVKLEFVRTSWPTLTEDTLANKFDVAITGITITEARQKVMDLSRGYLVNGKTILVRKADAKKFRSLADIDRKAVRVMFNPGGTNEKFARANLKKATFIVHERNAEIPSLIAAGKADVMITETMEARRFTRDDPRLAAPLIDEPFTVNYMGMLTQKGDAAFVDYLNAFIDGLEQSGELRALEARYID